jgi:type I restriction enzyme S subunit
VKTARHSQLSTFNPLFKQTEVGVIPEDWEVSTLGKHATFKTGPFGSALHKSDYVDGGVPVINPMQIVDGKIQPTPSMAVTEEAAHKLSDFRLSAGNIVIGRRGEMGRCAFVQSEQHGWLCGTGSMIVRTGPSLDGRFIQRILSSPPVIAAIKNASVGSTMINLNQGTLENLLIPLPPTKAEQEAIAEALSDADALIESLEQLIAKKRHIKQGAMQELLTGKKRLPGFATKPGYKQTEVGVIPEDWSVERLGEMGEALIGLTYSPANVQPDGLLVLRSSNIADGRLSFEDNVFIKMEVPDKIIVREGDILICVRNGSRDLIGKCAKIDKHAAGMTFGAFMAVFRTDFHDFVLQQFQSDIVERQIHAHLGATINQITNGSLNSFRIPLPPTVAEQISIATILSDMDTEIATLEDRLTKARQIKRGMMQELLTGKTRLVEREK